jgi:hypothetical protein
MKNIIKFLPLSFLTVFLFVSCSKSYESPQQSQTETPDTLELTIKYNDDSPSEVQRVINDFANPEVVFKSNNEKIKRTVTFNNVSFFLNASKSNISIWFDKKAHSDNDIRKMKKLFSDIHNVLKWY